MSALGVAALVFACEVPVMAAGKQVFRAGPDFGLPFSTAVRAGDLVFASGVLSTDGKGALVADDIRSQTRRTLDNLRASFEAAGTRLENAAAVNVYLTQASDFQAMNEVYRTYWTKDPPTRTTIVTGLVAPGALIEIAGVAVREGAERVPVHPSAWAQSPNPYSYGIRTGDTLFLSGLVPRDLRANTLVAGDVTVQTRAVMDNAGEILKAAGMGFADVASARVYIQDAADFAAMNEAYRGYFPADRPARATVKVGLTSPDFRVEVTLLAVKATDRRAFAMPGNPNLSSAVRAGSRLFVSGMLGNTDTTSGDARAQAREMFARIGRTLAAAGYGWPDVVDGIAYITDAAHFPALNDAYREVFKGDFPARATVLTGLLSPGAVVEVMFVAAK